MPSLPACLLPPLICYRLDLCTRACDLPVKRQPLSPPQIALVELKKIRPERYKKRYSRAFGVAEVAFDGNNCERFLIGRQILVILLVFVSARLTTITGMTGPFCAVGRGGSGGVRARARARVCVCVCVCVRDRSSTTLCNAGRCAWLLFLSPCSRLSIIQHLSLVLQALRGFEFPFLAQISGCLCLSSMGEVVSVGLPRVVEAGSLRLGASAKLAAVNLPRLRVVRGTFDVSNQALMASFSSPALESVGRDVRVKNNTGLVSFSLPNLRSVSHLGL